jgi:hypothetical protein
MHRARQTVTIRKRALRGLVWAAVVFGCSQAALGLTVRAGWLAVHDLAFANKAALLERHRPFRETGRSTVLAIGSSRIMCGLNARRLGEVLSTGVIPKRSRSTSASPPLAR